MHGKSKKAYSFRLVSHHWHARTSINKNHKSRRQNLSERSCHNLKKDGLLSSSSSLKAFLKPFWSSSARLYLIGRTLNRSNSNQIVVFFCIVLKFDNMLYLFPVIKAKCTVFYFYLEPSNFFNTFTLIGLRFIHKSASKSKLLWYLAYSAQIWTYFVFVSILSIFCQ